MVHQYKLNGYNIVLDTHSGSVHVVDSLAYDLIELYGQALELSGNAEFESLTKKISEDQKKKIVAEIISRHRASRGSDGKEESICDEDIYDCLSDIEELMDNKKLFTRDNFADKAFVLKGEAGQTGPVKALCLHVAHSCNLNCSYCFAAQGKYNGERALMSLEVGKKALDFLVENSPGRKNLEVDFFGGEPLMNFEVVKAIVAYGRSLEPLHNKKFRFTLTTNGILIDDEVIAFANKEMDNVVLSLDGRKEVHDRLRKSFSGEGSYDIILPKFKKMVKSRGGKNYYIRGTFTHYNTDFTEDLFHMAELGFDELSMEPVVCPPGDPFALTEEDLPAVMEQYEKLAIEMIERREKGKPFNFYHYMIDLSHGPCIYKSLSGCGSGTEYLAVTPWGELFPCHQFVNDPAYSMGNLREGVTNERAREEFRSCNVYSREECGECWAKLYCSGGCAANSYHATGNITGIYEQGCRLFKKRMECAIMLKVSEAV